MPHQAGTDSGVSFGGQVTESAGRRVAIHAVPDRVEKDRADFSANRGEWTLAPGRSVRDWGLVPVQSAASVGGRTPSYTSPMCRKVYESY